MSRVFSLTYRVPDESLLYVGHYDLALIVLSVLAAMFASYTALLVSKRAMEEVSSRNRQRWIALGGLSMGAGIWAMHFVGMLSFGVPCATGYNPTVTLISMVPGILASTVAMALISQASIGMRRLLTGGVLLGAGIGAMHYVGMAAYQLDGFIVYDTRWFILSVVVAVGLATLALWVRFRLMVLSLRWQVASLPISAMIMGAAVSGMHYTAMAAAYFVRGDATPTIALNPELLATTVLVVVCSLLVLTLLASQLRKGTSLTLRANYPLVFGLMVVWTACIWVATDHYMSKSYSILYQKEVQETTDSLNSIGLNLTDRLHLARGTAALTAQLREVQQSLNRVQSVSVMTTATDEEKYRLWRQSPKLVELNQQIDLMAAALDLRTIWVFNPQGECVAAGTGETAEACFTENVSNRTYFQNALNGHSSVQYTSGALSHEPGFYYAAPVLREGHVLGVVAVKYPLSQFVPLLENKHALILDQQGVVIAADKPEMVMRTEVDASAQQVSTTALQAQYGRALSSPIVLTPWEPERFKDVYQALPSPTPILKLHKSYDDLGIQIHIHKPVANLEHEFAKSFSLFLILALLGDVLILGIASLLLHLQSKRRETQLEQQHHREISAAFDEAKQARRLAEQRKNELQAVFDSTDVGIFRTDATAHILELNRCMINLFHYPRDTMVGMHYHELLPPEDREAAAIKTAHLLAGDAPYFNAERQYMRRDGSRFWGAVIGRPLIDNDGQISGVVGVLTDITERRQQDDIKARSEKRFRQLFENNGTVMLVLNPDTGDILDANHEACQYYGYTHETLIRMRIDQINTLTHEEIDGLMLLAVAKKQNYFSFKHRLASGDIRDVEVRSSPIDVDDRTVLLSVVTDVTERNRSAQQLKLAASVFTHAREGIMITDTSGLILDVNDTFSAITGYGHDEVLGKNPRFLKSNRTDAQCYRDMWRQLSEVGYWSGEIWNHRKDGGVYPQSMTITAVKNDQDVTSSYVSLFNDITEKKAREEQVEHHAHFDVLTNLPNRVLLADRLQQAVARSRRKNQGIAVIFLDLDGFKRINDTFGHAGGDALLVAVSHAMSAILREGDTLARVGGDEFVAVLVDIESPADVPPVLERLLLAAAAPVTIGEITTQVSASLGATFFPQDASDMEGLLRHADEAMYQAKESGKNQYRLYQTSTI